MKQRKIRCVKCVLVDGYAGATFEEVPGQGSVCILCRDFRRRAFLGKEQFLRDLGLAANERVAVTVSGGKDSSYVWGWLVRELGPERVVALNHHKVGIVHPLAQENLRTIQRTTGSELVRVDDAGFLERFRKNLPALLAEPSGAMVRVALCVGCRAGISIDLFVEAQRRGITKVVNAASYLELAPFKGTLIAEMGQGSETRGMLLGLYENPAYYHPENLLRIIKDNDLCHETAFHAHQGAGGGGVKYLHFFDYFENNPFEIRKLVESELGCRLPAGDDWHFDCHVETFKHLLYYAMLGYTETDFHLAQMVRYGVMAREQAVEALLAKRQQIAGGATEVFALARELGCDKKTVGDLEALVDQSEYLGSRRRTGARIAGYIGPARRLRKAS